MSGLQNFCKTLAKGISCFLLLICGCFPLISQSQEKISGTYGKKVSDYTPEKQIFSILRNRVSATSNCIDTSLRLIYKEDSITVFSNCNFTETADGNIYITTALTHGSFPTISHEGYLIKSTTSGNIIWAKRIIGGYINRYFGLNNAIETRDNGLLLTGEMFVPTPFNGRSELFLLKLNSSGNIAWYRTYKSTYLPDTTTGNLAVKDIKEDIDGSFYITAYNWTTAANLPNVLKFSSAGDLIWHKGFAIGSTPWFYGFDITNNLIRVFGKATLPVPGDPNPVNAITILNLNKTSGDTLGIKAFYPSDTNIYQRGLTGDADLKKLSNGNITIFGTTMGSFFNPNGPANTIHQSITEFDQNSNPVKSYAFISDETDFNSDLAMTVYDNGNALFARLKYLSTYSSDLLVGKFENDVIIKERIIANRGASISFVSKSQQLVNNGDLFAQRYADSTDNWFGLELLKLHDSDTSGSCLGNDTVITRVELQNMAPLSVKIDSVFTNYIVETQRSFTGIVDEQLNTLSNCQQLSFCDSLQLFASADTICSTDPLIITIHKNKECGREMSWMFDSTYIQSLNYLNDSIVRITFKNSSWEGFIYGQLTNCTLKDSIKIKVNGSPGPLNLGQDVALCPNNTKLLNAHSGYLTYLWQDGSPDSTYLVTTPGIYWVEVKDACNNTFRDTISITGAPPIPFDLGPDISKCQNDTLSITAPAGFINYTWSPGYNINTTIGQTVTVFPAFDTMYFVTAEMTPGCFAFDSIRIKNDYPSPSSFLPPDTSLCLYSTIQLNPLSSFNTYLWNNGFTSPVITVNSPGLYWLQVKNQYNCVGKDSIMVNPKQCLEGFYIPTAFTPNNDGRNDVFRPLLFGNVLKYEFSIYNRWGEIVFHTKELQKGWNGKVNGVDTDHNVFVWYCEYQFENNPEQSKKGTFVLVR